MGKLWAHERPNMEPVETIVPLRGNKGKKISRRQKKMEGQKMETLETLLKPEEVAEKLRIGVSTVYHLVHKGVLPGIKIGGTLRFSPQVLAKYVRDLGESGWAA